MSSWIDIRNVIYKLGNRWRCSHYWRPATTSRGLARWCEDCERIELLSRERFYAEFGEVGAEYQRRWAAR